MAATRRADATVAATATPAALETLRTRGDVAGQRAHGWQSFATIAAAFVPDGSVLRGWRDQAALFPAASATADGRGDGAAPAHQSIGAPLILLTHYNASAARHIETHALNSRAALERLRAAGARDPRLPALRAVPEFPSDAIVVKTCWWPVAANGTTPLPYWNPRREAGRRGGTPYTAWRSLVAIDPAPGLAASPAGARAARVSFAGRTEANAPRVGLDAFHHVPVDAPLARRLMADAEARRTASVVLGRPLRPGDHLALVAVHVATRELPEWIWITLWWQGPGPRTDGAAPPFPWRHYALDAAFDAELPRAGDGGARVAFNPWLEARMPDGGAGDGTRSNCLACHRRATYPGTRFLPVTRGAPDLAADPAFEPGKLSTGFLWSIATRAR